MVNKIMDILLSRNTGWCNIRTAAGITMMLLFLLAGSAGAVPSKEWNRTFTGAGNAIANSVQQIEDGGYILAGETYNPNQSGWLVKTDALGNEQWNRTFSDSYNARSIQQTADGGYIFVGTSSLIKTDASGNEQWNRKNSEIGTLESVQQTSDGGYIGAGYIVEQPGYGHPDAWLIKVDANGDEQWNRSFWGGGFGPINSVLQTKDGGYALAGLKGKYGALLIKVDDDGNEQWNWTFGELNRTSANSVVQANDGGYLLVGTMDVQTGLLLVGTMDLAAMFVKIDENGSMQWYKTRKFKGKDAAVPNSVQRTSDRGYIIAVEAHSYGGYNKDSWLIKTDENGNEQWNMTLGDAQDDEVFSVQQTGDGGYIVAGTTSFGAGKSYAWLRKVGEEQTGTAKTPDASPTETPIATQIMRAISNEKQTVSPAEKIAGFEVILPIAILLAVYKIGRKRR
jgi:hypothetical protein